MMILHPTMGEKGYDLNNIEKILKLFQRPYVNYYVIYLDNLEYNIGLSR
jgi:hypothetical protein